MLQKLIIVVCSLCFASITPTVPEKIKVIDLIVVEKSKRLMSVYYQNTLLKTYKISLGFAPEGHKHQEGDGKTPEGNYHIASKNAGSRFYRSLKVSYPSPADKTYAAQHKLDPGGDIMIHGLGRAFSWLGKMHTLRDWTLGCIAVTNEEIAEIFAATDVNALVTILP